MNRYQEKVIALTEFFGLHGLPKSLLSKTTAYVDALWSVNKGLDHHTLLHELPVHVRTEILMAAHK